MSRIIQNLQDSRQATYCPGNAFACSACFIRLFPSLVDWFNWSLPNFPAESFIHPQASFAVNFAVFGMFVVYAGVLSQGLVGICGVVLSESWGMGLLYQVCKMWVKARHVWPGLSRRDSV